MSLISYHDLVGVAYTEEETKAMAAEIDEGEMFTRAGKLSHRFPQQTNKQLGLPILQAHHNGQNYAFALLTGYRDPPAGVSIREGLNYNLYFPGELSLCLKCLMIVLWSMKMVPLQQKLRWEKILTFLTRAAEPEMEERKLLALVEAGYYRRLKWSVLKSRS